MAGVRPSGVRSLMQEMADSDMRNSTPAQIPHKTAMIDKNVSCLVPKNAYSKLQMICLVATVQ